MNKHFFYSIVLLVAVNCVGTLNILSILPYQGKSHFYVFKELLEQLAIKGHNVTVLSQFPRETPLENYHDISLTEPLEAIGNASEVIERSYLSIFGVGVYLVTTGRDNCRLMLSNKEVQHILQIKQHFDVVLIEQFNSDCGLGIAHKLNAPVVGLTSHVLMPWHYKRFGIPENPAYVPSHFLEGGTRPSLYQRIERLVIHTLFKYMYLYVSQRNNEKDIEIYTGEKVNLEDLAQNIKIILLYQHFSLTGSILFPSNIIEVGGYHVTEKQPLTGELKDFVENSEGIIYISFGSELKSSNLAKEKVDAILAAMAEFPQRFIWKWEDSTLVYDTKKLYIAKWLPQKDIFGHPKIMAFLSHGGMLGTTEAVSFGVPIVAVPILGDQPANAASIEEQGFGVQINFNDLNKDNLVTAFKTVLNPKFRDNVKTLSSAWHKRPQTSIETAMFWIEYVAKYPNLIYRSAAADVSFIQYMYLDVIAIVCLIIYLCRLILCRNNNSQKIPTKKTKRN